RLSVYSVTDFMVLDAVTQRNLELLEPAKHSLVSCMDRTRTPMGARLLREWLTHPLRSVAPIEERQDVIAAFAEGPTALANFRERLGSVRDMERTLGKLSVGTGSARDLAALQESLGALPKLKSAVAALGERGGLLSDLAGQITEQPDLVELISRAIVDGPPPGVRDGGMIREGFSAPLDELRRASTDGKNWIAALQLREVERTGIASVKVRYH